MRYATFVVYMHVSQLLRQVLDQSGRSRVHVLVLAKIAEMFYVMLIPRSVKIRQCLVQLEQPNT